MNRFVNADHNGAELRFTNQQDNRRGLWHAIRAGEADYGVIAPTLCGKTFKNQPAWTQQTEPNGALCIACFNEVAMRKE